jgi:hypothetical protein
LSDGRWLRFSALGTVQGREQTPGISRRAQEVGRFEESREFRGGEEGDVAGSFAADDNGFLLVYDAVEDTRQVLAEAGVGGFGGHWGAVFMVQDSCTWFAALSRLQLRFFIDDL